eukprot:4073805-Pyramimonas_sp.AAC.1
MGGPPRAMFGQASAARGRRRARPCHSPRPSLHGEYSSCESALVAAARSGPCPCHCRPCCPSCLRRAASAVGAPPRNPRRGLGLERRRRHPAAGRRQGCQG